MSNAKEPQPAMPVKQMLIGCVSVIAAGLLASYAIVKSEPEAQREGATKRTAMLVDVLPVSRGTYRPVIVSMGSVSPSQEVTLQPRVSGRVNARSENFRPGAFVTKDEVLVTIDRADYEIELASRQSELAQAQAALEIEQGEQVAAEQEYRQLGRNLPAMQEALILRKPQLDAARAELKAAEARVDRAALDLQRTEVTAPFDAQIVSRAVNVGSQVAPGNALARLVGIERYWVVATVPLAKMPNIDAVDELTVELRDRSAWPEGQIREGKVLSLVGELDEQSRMLRMLIEVDDPQARNEENAGKMPLVLGSYVESRITAEPLQDVVRLKREYLRKNDTAWVYQDGELSIRELDIAFMDAEHIYVRDGLSDGDRVVTTNLARIQDGAALRLAEGAQ
ncbi:efflux RND transporter periplasmic adaptor subunit [Gilvimarinus sp. SDUM040013]|uniref:Efflux RND transporter periplasmic adaptor subunit n=1 Tax=Gilvimarinus gilvus TaxID=3058038 RepID=A0ABU4RTL1_9GAMM|nr:efflux RND transporter periplasmic adaptor subunit [Gilvimarinus sp. SDUM040013]MDO3386852.1 efflux RND transporter periplasmic adaptor subunit [Gilvimarinus sp. SDUM040013]MDX6848218.1 efflux RND transporter periplasmic adaptor subunit [Gilvimarinus sp. SDUM040013]